MKTITIVLICLLSVSNVARASSDPIDVIDQSCSAIVQDSSAFFVFPILKDDPWTWYEKETKANELEYSWEVFINSQKEAFKLGLFLFKAKGDKPKKGTIRQLLKDAQLSTFLIQANTNGATSSKLIADENITLKLKNDGVVLVLDDLKIFQRIFASHPEKAKFSVRVHAGDVLPCEAAISYLDGKSQQSGAQGRKPAP